MRRLSLGDTNGDALTDLEQELSTLHRYHVETTTVMAAESDQLRSETQRLRKRLLRVLM